MLDAPRYDVELVARLLAGHRRQTAAPKGSGRRVRQAVLILGWFRDRACVHCLARDTGISQATGYRYLHEGIDVLAGQAPNLHNVLDRCRREGMTHVALDGTLIESDRVAGTHLNAEGKEVDIWYSAKHKAFGANVQFLPAPDGTPLWVSDAEPGSVPDITAARAHCLSALYKAAADGLPILADAGYQGAGIGTPVLEAPRRLLPAASSRQPHLQHAPARSVGPRRTGRSRVQRTLTHPQAHHPQPRPSAPSPKPPSSSTTPGDNFH
ncbi:IS5/IS1182 family transposase [Streptomyces sp. NBC_01005]|uniref:transposase family protein n=1 Tax=unclassified Streptomyces TaxID=2593676 RepID=UPI00386CC5C4|nr:IS5/IS1182 family transposase [Streptomyces sp. NBC_01005]WTC93393.1 IS5/IS1182 family transposase [Streptomyces sp. NBC_01650]